MYMYMYMYMYMCMNLELNLKPYARSLPAPTGALLGILPLGWPLKPSEKDS